MEPEWIEHDGSAVCPVPEGHDVELKYRNGEILRTTEAHVYRMDWDHDCLDMPQHDITHYRDWTVWEQRQESKMAEPKLLTEADFRACYDTMSYGALVKHFRERGLIAQEPEPVDPLLIEAREIAARQAEAKGYSSLARTYRDGGADDHAVVDAALAALRRGMELAERKPLTWEDVRDAYLSSKGTLTETALIDRLYAALTEAMQ